MIIPFFSRCPWYHDPNLFFVFFLVRDITTLNCDATTLNCELAFFGVLHLCGGVVVWWFGGVWDVYMLNKDVLVRELITNVVRCVLWLARGITTLHCFLFFLLTLFGVSCRDNWRFNIDKMFPLPEGKSWIILHNFLLHRRFVVRQESCMQQDVTLPRHPPQVLCGFDDKEFPMPDAWRESCQMCLVFGGGGSGSCCCFLIFWFWFSVILHPWFCTKTHGLHMGFVQSSGLESCVKVF